MAKHRVDLDEDALSTARHQVEQTLDEALRWATTSREGRVAAALDLLADDRADGWR